MPTKSELVRGRDLPDQRKFVKTGSSVTFGSPLIVQGTNPILRFDDTNNEDFELNVDADILNINNLTGPITFVRFRGGANDDIQVDRPIVFNSNTTISGTNPILTFLDTDNEDFTLNVNSDILNIICTTGPITFMRFRGGANDDIQVDRPITFNSTVSGLTFTDLTLSDTSPSVIFTDTNGDDYTILVDANVMTITNTTQGTSNTFKANGFILLTPKAINIDGSTIGNSGSTLTTLHTYSLPSGTLNADGDYLEVIYSGVFASNANTKRIQIEVAGQVVHNSGLFDIQSGSWTYRIGYLRLSSTSIRASVLATWGAITATSTPTLGGNGIAFAVSIDIGGLSNLSSNATTLRVRAQGTSNDDIQQLYSKLEATQVV